MECSFRRPDEKTYVEKDGVAMGSPLGVLFAEAFMAHVESTVMQNLEKSKIYCRYIDDIFVCSKGMAELTNLRVSFQKEFGLSFTIELSNTNKMLFLDVLVNISNGELKTSVYCKPKDTGTCLNGRSECKDSYKKGVMRAYVIRALNLSSTWHHCHRELQYIR